MIAARKFLPEPDNGLGNIGIGGRAVILVWLPRFGLYARSNHYSGAVVRDLKIILSTLPPCCGGRMRIRRVGFAPRIDRVMPARGCLLSACA